jgi:hypothetical protein
VYRVSACITGLSSTLPSISSGNLLQEYKSLLSTSRMKHNNTNGNSSFDCRLACTRERDSVCEKREGGQKERVLEREYMQFHSPSEVTLDELSTLLATQTDKDDR